MAFQVTGDGLTVRQDGTTLATITSLNQAMDMRFADGNVTVDQSGATEFTITGDDGSMQTVGTESGTGVTVPLGDDRSRTAPDPIPIDVAGTNTGPFDASGADVRFSLAAGTYTATINGFDSGDVLAPFDEAAITVDSDTDQSDGVQRITFADSASGTTATVELRGLTPSQDENLFDRDSIDAVFGDGTLDTGDDRGGTVEGQVLVDGSSVSDGIPVSASALTVGDDASGSLDLSDGQARTFTSNDFDNVEIAAQSGSSGSLSLSGEGTELVTAGTDDTVHIGRRGNGELILEAGADIWTHQFEVARNGGTGTATLRGTDTTVVASPENGRFSGEFVNEAGFVRAGDSGGSDGRIEVLDGARIEITPGQTNNTDTGSAFLEIGNESGSEGELLVSGAGSAIRIQSEQGVDINFGTSFIIGNDGSGTATVTDGAEIRVHALDGNTFNVVGDSGTGELNIESGGRVIINSTPSGSGFPKFVIGDEQNAEGDVTVTGNNSQLRVLGGQNSEIEVGDAGDGELTISNGGQAAAEFVFVGREQSGSGQVHIEGDGSMLDARQDNAGRVLIGVNFGDGGLVNSGDGAITVGDGATLRAGVATGDGIRDIIVGPDDTLTVADAGTVTGDVQVMGTGTFDLADGATHNGEIL